MNKHQLNVLLCNKRDLFKEITHDQYNKIKAKGLEYIDSLTGAESMDKVMANIELIWLQCCDDIKIPKEA